jgi:hypothetical protein
LYGTVFNLHPLQKGPLVVGRPGWLVLWINCNSLVPLPERWWLPERINGPSGNQIYIHWYTQLRIFFDLLLSSKLHHDEQFFLTLCHLQNQRLYHAILKRNPGAIPCDSGIQWDWMSLTHSQEQISEWPQCLHDMIGSGPFIQCCVLWQEISRCQILERQADDFSKSAGLLNQLPGHFPAFLDIHHE